MNDIQIPGLQEVEQSQVLDPAELRRLEALVPELEHAFTTRTIFRTPTEARFSVLNDLKHPTPASKYHQAKLEQAVMFDNLIKLSFAFRRAKIDLDDARARMKKASGRQKERLKVDMDELTYRLICMQKEAQERLRELEMWSEIKASLEGDFDRDNKDTDEACGPGQALHIGAASSPPIRGRCRRSSQRHSPGRDPDGRMQKAEPEHSG